MPTMTLPSGKVIEVPNLPPKGTPKESIMKGLIANGLATPEDFSTVPTEQISTSETILPMIGRGMVNLGRSAENILNLEGRPLTGGFPQGDEEANLVRPMIEQNPKTAFLSESIGEYGPASLVGGGIGKAAQKGAAFISAKIAPYIGAAAAGGAEGALIGGINDQAGTGAAVGAVGGAALQKVMPIVASKIASIFGPKAPIREMITVDPSGNIIATQSGRDIAASQGMDLDAIIASANTGATSPKGAPESIIAPMMEATQQSERKGAKAAAQLIPEMNINTARAAAAKAEGIELSPAALSDSPEFIEYQAALQEMPSSKTKFQDMQTIKAIGDSLEDLKGRLSGSSDKNFMDTRLITQFNNDTQKIAQKESRLYDEVRESVSGTGKGDAGNITSLIQSKAAEVGGIDKLADTHPAIYQIYKSISKTIPDGESSPAVTYGYLDGLRKQVGEGYNKSGGFKDSGRAELDMIYGALAQDQKALLNSLDPTLAKKYSVASNITKVRKGLEENIEQFGPTIGKDGKLVIGAPYITKMESALVNAAKGNPYEFNRLIEAVPKKHRSAVVISSMDKLLESRRMPTGDVTAIMSDAGLMLNRQELSKQAIYKHLPDYAKDRLNNLFMISEGVFNVQKRTNKSGTAKALLAAKDEQLGAMRKVFGVTARLAAAAVPGGQQVSNVAGATVGNILSEKSTTAIKADKLLASPNFQKALRDYADDKVGQAEVRIQSTPEYKAWIKEMSPTEKAIIDKQGFFRWMTTSAPAEAATQKEPEQPQAMPINQAPERAPSNLQNIFPDPNAMLEQAKQVERQERYVKSMQNIEQKANDMASTYKVEPNRKLAIDMQSIASNPKYVGMALLNDLYDGDQAHAKIAENFITVAMGKPQYKPTLKAVKNVLRNANVIPPDNKQDTINSMIAMGVKPEKAAIIANTIRPLKPQEAKKVAESIRAKLTPDMYNDFAPLISSIEALA